MQNMQTIDNKNKRLTLCINSNSKKVVALSTGTKCYPENQSSNSSNNGINSGINNGINSIIDCHAESLLKRAFKRHLISHLKDGFKIDNNIMITLFISQLPCGCLQRYKGNSNLNDSQLNYRKPGRGSLCSKPSCIKKIAKWNYMGLQGRQLIQLTRTPIYINNIVIGNCGEIGEYDQQMIIDMLSLNQTNCLTINPFNLNRLPSIKFCQQFRNDLFIKTQSKRSSSTAIVMWLESM
jgi:hypothetical protein